MRRCASLCWTPWPATLAWCRRSSSSWASLGAPAACCQALQTLRYCSLLHIVPSYLLAMPTQLHCVGQSGHAHVLLFRAL